MDWICTIRRFLGTGDLQFLRSAKEICPREGVQGFLSRLDEILNGRFDSDFWIHSATSALPQLADPSPRTLESALLRALFLVPWIPISWLSLTSPPQQVTAYLKELLRLAKEFNIAELNAYLYASQASIQLEIGSWKIAEVALNEAIASYRGLAESNPVDWTPSLTQTMNQYALALKGLGLTSRAEELLHEALRWEDSIRRRGTIISSFEDLKAANLLSPQEIRFHTVFSRIQGGTAIMAKRVELPEEISWWERVARYNHNLGNVLRERRQFPNAEKHLRQALSIRLRLSAIDSAQYRLPLAQTLNNLGHCLRDAEELRSADIVLTRGLKLLKAIATSGNPDSVEAYGLALQNLANVKGDLHDYEAASWLIMESIDVFSGLSNMTGAESHSQRLAIARIDGLTNLAEGEEFAKARSLIPTLLSQARTLSASGDPHSEILLAFALVKSALVFRATKEFHLMIRSAEEAIEICERLQPGESRQQLQGTVEPAYVLAADHYNSSSQSCFQYISALRGGHLSTGEFSAACASLQAVSSNMRKRMVIIFAQVIDSKDSVIGLVGPEASDFYFTSVKGLTAHAIHFTDLLLALLFPGSRTTIKAGEMESLSGASRAIWEQLPDPVRNILLPSKETMIAVSGDSFWNHFPWELLLPPFVRWLGLDQALPRWSLLSSSGIMRLAKKTCYLTTDSTMLVSPLCNLTDKASFQTSSMLEEYIFIVGLLVGKCGIKFDERTLLLGKNASMELLLDRLSRAPNFFHFIGHGRPGSQGSLLLWDKWGDLAELNPTVLREHKKRRPDSRFWGSGGLAFFNCCFGGHERRFGGQGEDLASLFMAEGADVVVASYLPILEKLGNKLVREFYRALLVRGRDVGQAILAARRRVAREYERTGDAMWLAWALMRITGNPFISLAPKLQGTVLTEP